MRAYTNECVGCPPEIGCTGTACPYYSIERFYCDECKEEKKLYEFNGQELCIDCIEGKLTVVEGSECYY